MGGLVHSHRFPCFLVSFLVHLKKGLDWLFTMVTLRVFIPLMKFIQWSLVLRAFLFYWGTFSFFFHPCLFDGVRFQCSQWLKISLASFLILSWFDSSVLSVISLFLFFIICMPHYHGTFISNDLTVYSYCLYQGFQFLFFVFFFSFGKYLVISYRDKIVKLFQWFCKFVACLCIS